MINFYINQAKSSSKNRIRFQEAMNQLAQALRNELASDYCAIGMVADGIAEDSAVAYEMSHDEIIAKQQEEAMNQVRSADENDGDTYVSKALNSDEKISFYKLDPSGSKYFEAYKIILNTNHIENTITTVIPIRDNEKHNFGFIQLINTKSSRCVDYERDISPIRDALLDLIQIIIQNKLIQKDRRLKVRLRDADFYNKMQEKKNNVDELIKNIMQYLSTEFNAAVISWRIPLLDGFDKRVLFYLRSLFIHPSLDKKSIDEIERIYQSERYEKTQGEMKITNELRCDHQGKILVSESDTNFAKYGLDLDFDRNTLVIPIFRDNENKCSNPLRDETTYCTEKEHQKCIHRFKRLYGIFRLRISKYDLSNQDAEYFLDLEDAEFRLKYLSQQVTLLLNAIVDKYENNSLQTFQDQLKNSSFININDFDASCVRIINECVHAEVCSIYRSGIRNGQTVLSLSATTAKKINFHVSDKDVLFDTSVIQKSCFVSIKDKNNILAKCFSEQSGSKEQKSTYFFNFMDSSIHKHKRLFIENAKGDGNRLSAMVIPMTKKDGTCDGVVLLLGKQEDLHPISTAYWERDIKHIEFIVNVLTRISESDTERLHFLSRLAHELLKPVTELVYENDYIVNIAKRDPDNLTKGLLIKNVRENFNRYFLFKYIITDVEYIYKTSGQNLQYNIAKQRNPKNIILDVIRLLEKEASSKGLKITTHLKQMPSLWFDKERMMQVLINLIKNAIRYADSYTTINVSYNLREQFHEISISNVGISILDDEKEAIFELFHRGEAAKKKDANGTGMGLYIVRDIMRAHGGDCFVQKTENPTIFAITLPL